jgi:DNA-binding MarR family transcriptional regulator
MDRRAISDMITMLTGVVEQLSRKLIEPADGRGQSPSGVDEQADVSPDVRALNVAKRIVAIRRRRERAFGGEMFFDPVWDILLELYVANGDRTNVSVGNACIASSVPMTSALRWCQLLQDRGLVYREKDPRDGRRIFLRMSDETHGRLTSLLTPIAPKVEQFVRDRS